MCGSQVNVYREVLSKLLYNTLTHVDEYKTMEVMLPTRASAAALNCLAALGKQTVMN